MQIRSIFNTGVYELLILGCGLASGIVAARWLGPDDRGLLAVIMFWPHLASHLGLFSVHQAVAVQAERHRHPQLLISAVTLALLLGALAALAGAALLPLLMQGDKAPALMVTVIFMLAFVPLNALGLVLMGVEQGRHHFHRYNLLRLASALCYVSLLVALIILDALTLQNAVYATFAAGAIVPLLGLAMNRHRLRQSPRRRISGKLLRTGLRFHAHSVASHISTHLDRLVVIPLIGNAGVGHYTVAISISMIASGIVSRSISAVTMPMLAAAKSPLQRYRTFRTALALAVTGATFSAVILIWLVPFLLPWLFGEAFTPAVPIATALLVASVPYAIRSAVAVSLKGLFHWRAGFVSEMATIAGFLLSAWPLWQHLGLEGLGWAMVAGNFAGLMVLLPVIWTHVRPNPEITSDSAS